MLYFPRLSYKCNNPVTPRPAMANYCPPRHTKFIRTIHSLFITVANYYSHFAKQANEGGGGGRTHLSSRGRIALDVTFNRRAYSNEKRIPSRYYFPIRRLSHSRFYLLACYPWNCGTFVRAGDSRVFIRVQRGTVRFSIKPRVRVAAFYPDYPRRTTRTGYLLRASERAKTGLLRRTRGGGNVVRELCIRGKLNENIGISSGGDFPQWCSFARSWWIEKAFFVLKKLNWPFRTRISSLFSRIRSVFTYKCIHQLRWVLYKANYEEIFIDDPSTLNTHDA